MSGPDNTEAGAGDGIRTRDINLGKVALYQLSYSRLQITFSFSLAPAKGVKQALPKIFFRLHDNTMRSCFNDSGFSYILLFIRG